jgi:hypothetical protein
MIFSKRRHSRSCERGGEFDSQFLTRLRVRNTSQGVYSRSVPSGVPFLLLAEVMLYQPLPEA